MGVWVQQAEHKWNQAQAEGSVKTPACQLTKCLTWCCQNEGGVEHATGYRAQLWLAQESTLLLQSTWILPEFGQLPG